MLRHQNRATKGTGYKFGHTPTIMCSMNLPQSRQEYQKGKGQSLQQMALGKPDSYTQKNEIRLLLYTIHTHTHKTVSRPQCETRNHTHPTRGQAVTS